MKPDLPDRPHVRVKHMKMQYNFTNSIKMDDFFSDFYTFLDNQTVVENDTFYIEYLELFKMNQRQVIFESWK